METRALSAIETEVSYTPLISTAFVLFLHTPELDLACHAEPHEGQKAKTLPPRVITITKMGSTKTWRDNLQSFLWH